MDPAHNPFSPGAGTQPPELTGRTAVLEEARIVLDRVRAGRPARSCLLFGLRGVGKTVLLNRIDADSRAAGYRSAVLEAPEGGRLPELLVPPLRQILLELDTWEGAKQKMRRAYGALLSFASHFKVEIGDLGVGLEPPRGVADSGVLRNDLGDLLVAVGEAAAEHGTAVALLIDELQYVTESELTALVASVHKIAQLNLPLVVFGAGLPQLIGLTGKAKSYAERLFEFKEVGPLDAVSAAAAVRDPIAREGAAITPDALDQIVQLTEGYPYFLQEWAFHTWRRAPRSPIAKDDVAAATHEAVAALDRGFFQVRFDRLTPMERMYLRAMAHLGRGPHYRSADVASALGRSLEEVAPIRARVIAKGMAYAPAHGVSAFTVPMFDDYMRRVMPEFTPPPPRRRVRTQRPQRSARSPRRADGGRNTGREIADDASGTE